MSKKEHRKKSETNDFGFLQWLSENVWEGWGDGYTYLYVLTRLCFACSKINKQNGKQKNNINKLT